MNLKEHVHNILLILKLFYIIKISLNEDIKNDEPKISQ